MEMDDDGLIGECRECLWHKHVSAMVCYLFNGHSNPEWLSMDSDENGRWRVLSQDGDE